METENLEVLAQLTLDQRMGQSQILNLLRDRGMNARQLGQDVILVCRWPFFYALIYKLVELLDCLLIIVVTPSQKLVDLILYGGSLIL